MTNGLSGGQTRPSEQIYYALGGMLGGSRLSPKVKTKFGKMKMKKISKSNIENKNSENDQRQAEILKICDDPKLRYLAGEMVRLEKELDYLRGKPKYREHPTDPSIIKVTPAFHAYSKLLSQYKEIVKLLMKETGESGDSSPLREYLNSLRGD